MASRLRPDLRIDRLTSLDLAELKKRNITRLMLDIDNTLVAWKSDLISDEYLAWVLALPDKGFAACLLSNNTPKRVAPIARVLGLRAFCWSAKPNAWGFRRAMRAMGWTKDTVAVIGDQLLTDVLGGNRAGCYTVLVTPLSTQEMGYTKMVRRLERRLMRNWK